MSENKYPIGGYAPGINELIRSVEAMVYYSQIYTVKGVQPVNMPDHETAWRNAQHWLWANCKADDYGNYYLKDRFLDDAKPAGAVCPDFIEYIKNERSAISNEMLSDGWWLTMPPSKRVVIENILIAYDQMAGKLNGSKPAAYER